MKLAAVDLTLVARHQHDGSLQAGAAWGTLRETQQSQIWCLSVWLGELVKRYEVNRAVTMVDFHYMINAKLVNSQ